MSGCGFLAQALFIITCYILYARTGSQALLAQTLFMTPGLFLWLVVYLHGRQKRLAASEKEELEDIRKGRLSEEIFEEQQLDRMRAHTGLKIFEKYFVPAFSVILSGALAFLSFWNLNVVIRTETMEAMEPLAAVAGMAAVTFFGFLLGKYATGLAHSERYQLLRAPASYLMGNVLTGILLVIAYAMVHFGFPWLEVISAYLIPIFMGIIALEVLLNMVLDIYRPRLPDQEWRPAYDSRLLNLCAEPAGVFETFAAMLDYQFGFKISETWLYSFMQRAILPLLLIQIFALWSLSTLVVIQPGEAAFIERLGRPRLRSPDQEAGLPASLYKPGFHLKLPWPIETIRRIEADNIYRKTVGKLIYEDEPYLERTEMTEMEEETQVQRDENVILWRELHVEPNAGVEAQFLVPSLEEVEIEHAAPSLNLARLMARLHYRIRRDPSSGVDVQSAYNFYYRHEDPHRLIENLAFQTVCKIAASQNFLRWIHIEREEVSRRFARKLQESIDRLELGIDLVYAGLPSIHPPAAVAEAYESVINAYEQKETMINQGKREAVMMVKEAEGEAAERLNRAEAYAYELTEISEAEQSQFQVRLKAYDQAPQVYRFRQHFTAIEDVLAGHHLYIVPVTEKEVNIIDMKGRRPTDILDIDLEDSLR